MIFYRMIRFNRLVLLLLLIIISAYTYHSFFNQKETYTIALVGPMSGKSKKLGNEMKLAINLYLNQLKTDPLWKDLDIQLKIYDDQNNVEKAQQIASVIAEDSDVLMVIGHYYSSTSIAAGKIYKEAGIPAITGSATAEKLIRDNDYYFRVTPGNAFQGKFIANYVYSVLKQKSVIIINDSDAYGSDLANNFEEAASELNIKYKRLTFHSSSLEKDLERIISQLISLKEPAFIFLATHMAEAAVIIASIKFPGTQYSIIGSDSTASEAFIKYLKTISFQERAIPGYHSNDMSVISPFIFDVGGEDAQVFKNQYKDYSKESPSWVAAGYYDAIHVAANAVKYVSSFKNAQIEHKRTKAWTYLNQLDTYEAGLDGVTGRIFFSNQEILRPFAVGQFRNQKLISTLSQYKMVASDEKDAIDILKQVLEGQNIIVNDILMTKMRLAYTGIDINEISELNISDGTYLIDFYLWFRFKSDFKDAENIEFINSLKSLRIYGDPELNPKNISLVFDQEKDGIITKTYQIRATFKNKFDLRNYPFDQQKLCIKFRHCKYSSDKLIFISDVIRMRKFLKNEYSKEIDAYTLNGWELQNPIFFQDYISNSSTLGARDSNLSQNKILFSQFNANITIKRKVTSFLSKNLCLLIVLLLLSYIIFFIPPDQFGIRVSMGMSTLLTAVFSHNRLTQRISVSYLMTMEYIYFVIYCLALISIMVSVLIYQCYKKASIKGQPKHIIDINLKRIKLYTQLGIVFYPLISSILAYILLLQNIPEYSYVHMLIVLLIPLVIGLSLYSTRSYVESKRKTIELEIEQL